MVSYWDEGNFLFKVWSIQINLKCLLKSNFVFAVSKTKVKVGTFQL